MKIDNYTRFLLTTIALCLLYLCGRDVVTAPKVHADAPLEVVLVDGHGYALCNPYGTSRGAALPVAVER